MNEFCINAGWFAIGVAIGIIVFLLGFICSHKHKPRALFSLEEIEAKYKNTREQEK